MNCSELRTGYRYILVVFLSILICVVPISGCHLLKHDKKSEVERKQQAEAKQAEAEYAKACRQHQKNQNKATRKMMKQTKKKAAKVNRPIRRKRKSGPKCSS